MGSQVCHTTNSIALHLHIWAKHLTDEGLEATKLDYEQFVIGFIPNPVSDISTLRRKRKDALFTAKFPRAALAARCTSVSRLLSRNKMGSSVSRPTGRTSFSVISAKARAALRWRSTLSENESVVSAESGDPVKKLVVVRSTMPSHISHPRSPDTTPVSTYTHSPNIVKDLPLPLARFQAREARTTVTCASGLRRKISQSCIVSESGEIHTA